jgi:hypothetical protein
MFGNLGELRADTFELFIDDAVILKRKSDLLLCLGTQPIISRCQSWVILCNLLEALNLVFGSAAPVVVLVSLTKLKKQYWHCKKPCCSGLDANFSLLSGMVQI